MDEIIAPDFNETEVNQQDDINEEEPNDFDSKTDVARHRTTKSLGDENLR